MTASNAKQLHERKVFDRFLAISQLQVHVDTIRPGDPNCREPDIVCDLIGVGPTGFELTRIAQADFMETRSLDDRANEALRSRYAELSPGRKATLDDMYRDADVAVRLSFDGGIKSINTAIPAAFTALESLPRGCTGEWKVPPRRRHGAFRSIYITRYAKQIGPILYVPHPGGWVGDVTVPRLAAKFGRQYNPEPSRRELVAYFAEQPPTLDDVRKPLLNGYLDNLRNFGPFARIWVLNLWAGAIEQQRTAPADGPLTSTY